MALDSADRPHVTYLESYTPGNLRHTCHDGNSWQIETVDDSGEIGEYNALALDGAGYPCIGYYDDTYGDLKCAYLSKGGRYDIYLPLIFNVSPMATPTPTGAATATTIPMPPETPTVALTTPATPGWHIETVDTPKDFASMGPRSIALDSAGYPHISYLDGSELVF